MGESGVIKVLEVIYKELDILMGLVGWCIIDEIDCDVLMVLKGFFGEWE